MKKYFPTKSAARRPKSEQWGKFDTQKNVKHEMINLFAPRYKEFCIHSANVHGGLVEALLRDEREELRSLAPKFKAIRSR